jgi:8-oxo-dGTP diphosphatase
MKLTVDAVVFSYHEGELKTLLIKRAFDPFKDSYALAGGFVNDHESTDEAVLRKLKEETNIDLAYLEQLYTFSAIDRDPRERIVSITYYGLINPSKHELITNVHAKEVIWHPTNDVKNLPLAFDHLKIHEYGLERLRNKLRYEPIGFELLPKRFSMSELLELYSTISGEEIDKRNFIKKINTFGLLNKTAYQTDGNVGRKAYLFEFNKNKYNELSKKGFNFEI